ncbi:MAG TPA: glycosyl hydrolase [Chloroflexota bacterium]|nr:glycosyl hydrolase [Chloroflexota bacterium]
MLLGAYRPEFWQPASAQSTASIAALGQAIGEPLGIVHWFVGWGTNKDLDLSALRSVSDRGAVPMITWEPAAGKPEDPTWTLRASVLSGANDQYITSWAQGLAAYGKPVLLRFAHEMHNTSYSWGLGVNGNTAADYVAAWRHVHDIFVQNGAANVKWVWNPNTMGDATTDAYLPIYSSLYPGDDVVDFVGLDVYNTGPDVDWGAPRWRSFSDILSAPYQAITQVSNKPLILPEVGSAEDGGSKPDWIKDALSPQTLGAFPRLRAFVWFDDNKETQWSLTSSPGAWGAWSVAARNPEFATKVDTLVG